MTLRLIRIALIPITRTQIHARLTARYNFSVMFTLQFVKFYILQTNPILMNVES